jgi:predicted TIM-barrel fold metal-dependent hydrolase
VACQSQDDVPYLLQFGMEDNLLVGTDYTHADQSAELMALDVIEQRGASGEVPAGVVRKILEDNPRRFYGL